MHARLEVPIAAQHTGGDKILCVKSCLHFFVERPAVPDAGGASVADDVVAEFLHITQQAGVLQVFCHDARAGGEAGFDVIGDAQPFLHRFFGEESRAYHHGWVAGVGAARNRRDDDGAVRDVVGVGLGIVGFRDAESAIGSWAREEFAERSLHVRQSDSVLGPPRSGDTRFNVG